MITENLSTLKIHKLSQEQYDRELAAGRIDETALYLTPDEDSDVVGQATEQGGEIFNDYDNNKATAPYSHAQGQSTEAAGVASSASGFNTKAAQTHQFVVGRYNDNKDATLFEVGNGTTNNSRSNAFEVYKDGHAEVQTMGSTENSVVTKDYVDNTFTTGEAVDQRIDEYARDVQETYATKEYVDSKIYIGSEAPTNPVEGMIWITPLIQ